MADVSQILTLTGFILGILRETFFNIKRNFKTGKNEWGALRTFFEFVVLFWAAVSASFQIIRDNDPGIYLYVGSPDSFTWIYLGLMVLSLIVGFYEDRAASNPRVRTNLFFAFGILYVANLIVPAYIIIGTYVRGDSVLPSEYGTAALFLIPSGILSLFQCIKANKGWYVIVQILHFGMYAGTLIWLSLFGFVLEEVSFAFAELFVITMFVELSTIIHIEYVRMESTDESNV